MLVNKAPQVALYSRAQVVHQGHLLEGDGVADVDLVGLVLELQLPDQDVKGSLLVVDQRRPLRDVGLHRLFYARRGRLAVLEHDGDRLLAGVDADHDAELLLREAALAGLAIALREVGVVYVRLVDSDAPLRTIRSW